MTLEAKVRQRLESGAIRRPGETLQGVSKERVEQVLSFLDRNTSDCRDAVFALLDNQTPSWFGSAARAGFRFSHGASTAAIACHIGLLQRSVGKLDREGRDYWLKPLWEMGALEKVTFYEGAYIAGHPIAKCPTSGYRITDSFRAILQAGVDEWREMLAEWSNADAIRERLANQARLAELARAAVDTSHEQLIQAAIDHYVPRFLPGFQVVYVDSADGERITDEDRKLLSQAGLNLELGDSMPDVLLWNPTTDMLWVIEAVTSDGEVDLHKVAGVTAIANRCGKEGVGFTTAFQTWKAAASRQGKMKNLAPDTYLWVQEDGSKHFRVETAEARQKSLQ